MEHESFSDEFHLVDLRLLENCLKVTKDVDHVFNLAADMCGMGFIHSNNGSILYNNTMISFNMMEAARVNKCSRFFYASSACVYPEFRQEETDNPGLKESDAWPARPQDAYGLEKLVSEEIALHYAKDFGFETRCGRFHNIFGPQGTWRGGREKAPAAFCRKVIAAEGELEIWGDGQQSRSFCYIDDCVEAILRYTASDYKEPINIGSDRLVTINDLVDIVCKIEGKELKRKHIEGPMGVRGRNSDNTLIQKVLGWAPCIPLEEGLKRTAEWIKSEMQKAIKEEGGDMSQFSKSTIMTTRAPTEMNTMREADGKEKV
jgi:GDP-D-mannose 3',5'-epimerase